MFIVKHKQPEPKVSTVGAKLRSTKAQAKKHNVVWHKLATRDAQKINTKNVQPTIQTKLTVGAANDKFEQEADRVADQVMRMPEPQEDEELGIQRRVEPPAVQRMCAECEEELQSQPVEEEETEALQMKGEPGGGSVEMRLSNAQMSQIKSLRGRGEPLSPQTRIFFESRFGQNFSHVRIHTNSQAAETAYAIHAKAFTKGQDIVFGAGKYAPNTKAGRLLLAHELTHTLQQQELKSNQIQRQDDKDETAAASGDFSRDKMLDTILCGQGGDGLSGRTKVGDIFQLKGSMPAIPTQYSRTLIKDLRTGNDKMYYIGDWLDNEWEIVDIPPAYPNYCPKVITINATCGTEEILEVCKGQPEASETIVDVKFGKNSIPGTLTISGNCTKLEVTFNDSPQDSYQYLWKDPPGLWVDQNGRAYAPPDLENLLGVNLQREKCGQPKERSYNTPAEQGGGGSFENPM